LLKVRIFSKNWKAAEKFAEIGKKVFRGNRFLQKALGNFAEIQSDFCKNRVFLPIFAKKFLQTFPQCPPHYPHGERGSNPAF
jgi:hypothetical protein